MYSLQMMSYEATTILWKNWVFSLRAEEAMQEEGLESLMFWGEARGRVEEAFKGCEMEKLMQKYIEDGEIMKDEKLSMMFGRYCEYHDVPLRRDWTKEVRKTMIMKWMDDRPLEENSMVL